MQATLVSGSEQLRRRLNCELQLQYALTPPMVKERLSDGSVIELDPKVLAKQAKEAREAAAHAGKKGKKGKKGKGKKGGAPEPPPRQLIWVIYDAPGTGVGR